MAANKLSHVPDNIESIRSVRAYSSQTGYDITTDTNGFVAVGSVKNDDARTYVISARCDAKNIALIPWMTLEGNWYLTAVAPASMAVQKSTYLGGVRFLVATLKSV